MTDFDRVFQEDADRKREKQKGHKALLFRDYLNLVKADPLIAQNSPSRILEVVLAAGVEDIPEADRWLGVDKRYKLFSDTLYGLEKPIADMVSHFKSGAARLSTGKQILLLVGPTASGKSTTANKLKRALENYNLRPVFKISGCPMFEEPLHLLPRYLREQAEKRQEDCTDCSETHIHLGVKIEGDLCPYCRFTMDSFKDKDGSIRWWEVPVETFTFSIQGTRGIGSFEPTDEKASDVAELVGREDIAVSSTKGVDHPHAYKLTGELEKANRGLCEGRELIKADEKLLWVFISVAEEKEIKVQGSSLPHISVDTVVIGHTNLTEFKKFATKKENEALHDRIYTIPVPYPLRVRQEVRIYKKLINEESDFARLQKCHIAPEALEIAAIFAILTRLLDSQMGVDKLTKLKIYNGDIALTEIQNRDKAPIDVRQLIEEGQASPDISKREGMFGVSSRDVLAALNTAMVQQQGQNGCLTPLRVVRALREVFDHRMGYSAEEIERFKSVLSAGEGGSVMSEYRDFVVKSVSRAFLRTYSDLAQELFRKYIDEAKFYRDRKRKFVRGQTLEVRRDDVTDKPKEPDLKLLRSIEEHIPVSESEADVFRGEILEFQATNPSFGYNTYKPLADAVEKKLLHDSKSVLTMVLDQDKPRGEEDMRRMKDLFSALEEAGHCRVCAREKVEKAREFLSE